MSFGLVPGGRLAVLGRSRLTASSALQASTARLLADGARRAGVAIDRLAHGTRGRHADDVDASMARAVLEPRPRGRGRHSTRPRRGRCSDRVHVRATKDGPSDAQTAPKGTATATPRTTSPARPLLPKASTSVAPAPHDTADAANAADKHPAGAAPGRARGQSRAGRAARRRDPHGCDAAAATPGSALPHSARGERTRSARRPGLLQHGTSKASRPWPRRVLHREEPL